ncbi:MAG TPA: transglutaminase-like cysteine peptidase [Pseudolabrys sp.]|nr:transglutaminase-like cysteine peptidase [Pseudolabrys sp.]
MSVFAKAARICLLVTAVFSASTFADEHRGELSLSADGVSDGITVAEATFDNELDVRALPGLPAARVESPVEKPIAIEPPSIWQRAVAAKLTETSAKWTELQGRIRAEKETLAACRSGGACPTVARRFLAIVDHARPRQGRARLGEINRAINLSIRPMSDWDQYGVEDFWSSPLATLSHGAGDCKDYAIAKYVALQEAGVAADDLRLEIVRDVEHRVTHAVVAARYDNTWWILDNRTLIMVTADDDRNYEPLFALNEGGVSAVAGKAAFREAVANSFDISSNLAAVGHPQKGD